MSHFSDPCTIKANVESSSLRQQDAAEMAYDMKTKCGNLQVLYGDRFLETMILWPSLFYIKIEIYTANKTNNKLRGFSPWANYTDQATAACQRS
jgi:hypothetical protein